VTYKFNNGSFSLAQEGTYSGTYSGTYNGTYTTSGNTLRLAMQTATQVETYQYSISGNTLTLTRYYYGDYADVKTLTKTSSGGGTDPLNGTWTYTNDYGETETYKFDNGRLVISYGGETYTDTGTYTTSGNKIIFPGGEEYWQYSISGDTLTITVLDETDPETGKKYTQTETFIKK